MNEATLPSFLQYWYVWAVGSLLAAIAVGFVARFILPARRIGGELGVAIAALGALKARSGTAVVGLDAIAQEAMASPRLRRIWEEYAETLHPQADGSGMAGPARWRATALADSFFTEQALVDSPLKTEFYKHLPGILTGLGIIGTFTGLIIGLVHFDVSLDPNQAQTQLRNLINAVGHAFIVSAVAITLAMLFTWIEKSLLTARYRQVEELRELIDGMFDVGADVEYLERLVVAAETSAAQAVHIKDALADQLREIFSEVASRQVEASARHGERLSTDLGRVIADRLGQPNADIAAAVNSVGARQDEVVNKMIVEVLAGFSAQMQNMFAGQMRDMSELLQQTNAAMRTTSDQFAQMAARMDTAGREAVAAMGANLGTAIASTEQRQQAMEQQVGAFVGQIRTAMLDAQTSSGAALEQTLARLGDQVAAAVGQLQDQARSAADVQHEQTERISRQAGEAVSGISGQVERLIARSIEASQAVQASVEKLSTATGAAVDGMNAGADTLAVAADDLAKAGQGVATTMEATAAAMENINFAANTLLSASQVTQKMLDGHSEAYASFAALVADLKATVEQAKREASLSAGLVDRLQAAAGQLTAAERKAEEYLDRVNDVIIKAHQSFADNVERTLRESNRQFQKELSQAVSLLSGAIQDLGDTLDELPAKRAVR